LIYYYYYYYYYSRSLIRFSQCTARLAGGAIAGAEAEFRCHSQTT